MHDLDLKIQELKELALEYNLTLSTAESCTGGSLAACITNVPGCSAWFERGFVTYSNSAKHEMLGVPIDLLVNFGAVSGEVVKAMAEGALINSHTDISIAITGIAGPDGGSAAKPVGTVWIGYASKHKVESQCYFFNGDRQKIRETAVFESINGAINFIKS